MEQQALHSRLGLTQELIDEFEQIPVGEVDIFQSKLDMLSVEGVSPDWIWSKEVWPHKDVAYENHEFVTLSVYGNGFYFGSQSLGEKLARSGCVTASFDCPLRIGDLMLINPLELHWLRPDTFADTWVGLQWTVPKGSAHEWLEKIAEKLNTLFQGACRIPEWVKA